MKDTVTRMLSLVLLCTWLLISGAEARDTDARWNAFTLYGGRLTANVWEEVFNPEELAFVDAYLVAATLSRRLGGYRDLLSYELEGQLVRHFGDQDLWEMNALATLRWEPFWWDEHLDTSLAFGLGPSYASETPQVEVAIDGESQRFMVYWMLEFAFSPPSHSRFALVTRLHHRSGAYGLVADEGGSNALALGLRYRF